MRPRHINVFSGGGGFEFAAEAVGWENVASCDTLPFAKKVLQYRFGQNHTVFHNAKDTQQFRQFRDTIHVVSMSPPCQPFSNAGKKLGWDDHRNLLPVAVGILDTIRPQWAVIENVPQLATLQNGFACRWLIGNLEALGYASVPIRIDAGSRGGVHIRPRLWLVAHAHTQRWQPRQFSTIPVPEDKKRGPNPHQLSNAARLRATGQAGILGMYNGLPPGLDANRAPRIRMMGNAIFPSVAYDIFQAIDECLRG